MKTEPASRSARRPRITLPIRPRRRPAAEAAPRTAPLAPIAPFAPIARRAAGAPLALLAAGFFFLLALAVAPAARLAADPLNRIVLRVNDQIATLYDYEQRRDDVERDIRQRVTNVDEREKELSAAPESVFRDMFQELLLNSRADQMAIEVSEKEVDDQIADMKQHFGIKTDEEFQQALRQSGMTLEALRSQARRTIRIRDVVGKEVQAKIKVKDEDLRRYYRKNQAEFEVPEQVQLREVVVLEDGGLPAQERSQVASQIRASVASGKSLADAVAPFAEKGQTSRVVELGWVGSKDLDPTLEKGVWKLTKGSLSDPIEARGGIHILQMVDRHPGQVRPFSEVSQQIQRKEESRLYAEESVKYLADLEARSLVVADPPAEAANFRRKIGIQDTQTGGLTGAVSASPTSAASATPTPGAPGAPAAPATPATPATPANAAAGSTLSGTHPTAVDTSDQKPGGVPPAQPVGAPAKDPLAIPPPASSPPPAQAPATPPPPPPGSPSGH